MAKRSIVRQPEGWTLPRRSPDGLRLPDTDNAPGAPEALLRANKLLRARRWPTPYDRTRHEMVVGDARDLSFLPSESVHLVVTSPPYFNLKPYASDNEGRQLGRIEDYDAFLDELDLAWRECARVLVPGGRICCVIGDILIPRRVPAWGAGTSSPLSGSTLCRSYFAVTNREHNPRSPWPDWIHGCPVRGIRLR